MKMYNLILIAALFFTSCSNGVVIERKISSTKKLGKILGKVGGKYHISGDCPAFSRHSNYGDPGEVSIHIDEERLSIDIIGNVGKSEIGTTATIIFDLENSTFERESEYKIVGGILSAKRFPEGDLVKYRKHSLEYLGEGRFQYLRRYHNFRSLNCILVRE